MYNTIGILSIFFGFFATSALSDSSVGEIQQKILTAADNLFQEYQVSYAYGGARLGSDEQCHTCNQCLAKKKPDPKERFAACGVCLECSIDCSHFTHEVFKRAGLTSSYLTTKTMLAASAHRLAKLYRLIDLGRDVQGLRTGDLLVYKGHVALLVRAYPGGYGDIIHATGGRDVRLPGQGIQKERRVPLAGFRGPLLRALRHKALAIGRDVRGKLRPVAKNQPD